MVRFTIVILSISDFVLLSAEILIMADEGDIITFKKLYVSVLAEIEGFQWIAFIVFASKHSNNVLLNSCDRSFKLPTSGATNDLVVLDGSAIHEVLAESDIAFFEEINLFLNSLRPRF